MELSSSESKLIDESRYDIELDAQYDDVRNHHISQVYVEKAV